MHPESHNFIRDQPSYVSMTESSAMRIIIPLTAVMLFYSNIWGQSIEDLVSGPVEGLTYVPAPGKLALSAAFTSVASTSDFDARGEVITYASMSNDVADPQLTIAALEIALELALSDHLGIAVSVPVILKQEIAYHPDSGYEGYFRDLSSESRQYFRGLHATLEREELSQASRYAGARIDTIMSDGPEYHIHWATGSG
jgi:hypothetical protein